MSVHRGTLKPKGLPLFVPRFLKNKNPRQIRYATPLALRIWESHDKAQVKSLDDRGSVGHLLDINVWQCGTARLMQDGIVVKGLAPKLLDPSRYHLNPRTDLNELEKGMPWRAIKDEFGKAEMD